MDIPAKCFISQSSPFSTGTLFVKVSLFPQKSWERYFPFFQKTQKRCKISPRALFSFEEWQSICSADRATDVAIAVLKTSVVVLATVKQMLLHFQLRRAPVKRNHCQSLDYSINFFRSPSFTLRSRKPRLMRSGKWRIAYWRKPSTRSTLICPCGSLRF